MKHTPTPTERVMKGFIALMVLVLFVTYVPAPMWVDGLIGFLLGAASQA